MKNFRERFDVRNECLYSVVDFAYYFLYNQYADYEAIGRCRTWNNIYTFFQKRGVHIVCRCYPIFFFNPISYYLCLKSFLYSRRQRPEGKIAIITFSSALELYGINDFWTHYICETIENKAHHLYDPYIRFIREDYPGVEYRSLKPGNLRESKKFQFILWR